MKTMLRMAVAAMAALTLVQANVVKSGGSGKWSDPSVWTGGVRPSEKDSVMITSECVVTIDSNYSVMTLTVQGGGTLQFDGVANWKLVSIGDMTIETGGTIVPSAPFSSGSAYNTLSIGRNLTVDGTVKDTVKGTSGDVRAIQKINMDMWYNTGNVKIQGKGSIQGNYLIIAKDSKDTVTVMPGVQVKVSYLYIVVGSIDNRQNNISTLLVNRESENGRIAVAPAYRSGPGAPTVYYLGTTDITTGVELPDTVAVLINQSSAKTLTMKKSVVVTGTLSLNDGKINTGQYVITATGSVVNNYNPNGYVIGQLKKPVSKASDTVKVFEIGSAAGYAEARLRFGTLIAKGSVIAQSPSEFHKSLLDTSAALKRTWYFSVKDTVLFKTCELRLRYSANDLPKGIAEPKLEPLLQVAQWVGGKWNLLTVAARDTSGPGGTITVSGVTSLTDFVIVVDQKALAVGNHEIGVPTETSLTQNYPNPFNPSTRLQYHIAQAGPVSLTVYDMLGKEIATLVSAVQNSGDHSADFDGTRFSSGMYFAVLRSGGTMQMRKMLLLK